MSKEFDFPSQGDVIIIDAEPHAGREYGGHDPQKNNIRRYMVVISNSSYNKKTGMIVAMPISTVSRLKNDKRFYPILIPDKQNGIKGFVCLWQIQNFDFVHRHGKVVNCVKREYLETLINFANAIIELDQ
ncbi:Toxin-antitoxin system, toxin component, MazF family (plasmid) [Lactobacillus helsingborgensis]|uniref:Type II toxin-antitoxin system PemK/MazF family toxin n=2 Tax=Lactobacillus TaxID=1578 RepID=A0AA47B5P9_9LACO|nr:MULTISPECIES: type II toxin-antitoxin system PemK/MazF family toxin [Lactobacillus]KJY54728.1 Toxin-antitoxin system, toxin component, MazF family [Lactobacillus melliventris]KJY60565.1 Toxin-antitoxin system, toxin component, MazF family [Lactobacillus helsingborgensis]UZX30611.1 type II toxin-antitoxin system PemK/MazF family toxin [Lactobacillus helsingborgensis]UZX32454.1 type II toxin-antitoxin system PemK/MazF family toxin [Lactobacillus helsingborgensis]